ncbi:Cd2 antigen cytoplasmic tail-binding protein 2, partial [Globisporangium splendens]
MSKRHRGNGGGGGAGRYKKNDEEGGESYGVTAFNMNDENDEGHFDDAGNFVWNKEDTRVQEEAWLDGVSEEQIGAALHAKNRREYRDEQAVETMTEERANSVLASLLNSRETVLQALQRLGSKRKKVRGTKRKQQALEEDATPKQTPEEKAQFEQITEAADFLMRQGEVDVYSQIKEEFMTEDDAVAFSQRQRQLQSNEEERRVTFAASAETEEEGKSEERPPQKQETMWEYRGADGEIHGPFPSSSFIAWQQQGYFTGDSAVDIRQVVPSADASSDKEAEPVAKPKEPEQEKISAEQELLNDFEDSEDDEENAKAETEEEKAEEQQPWLRSDQIDFSSY